MSSADERRDELKAVFHECRSCVRCPQLASTRHSVVFGAGNADADLMFVGEAPGANEDRQGLPFVGQAGKLLDTLLGEIGLARSEVFVANVLRCLRYNAQVQLGDGSWERIGRLVRRRYDGTVMSVDDDGHLVPRRVTGWHATPLGGRSVYRLTYRSAKNVGRHQVNVELTGDHRVLTKRGYVAASDLQTGDLVATGQGLSDLARDVVCGSLLGDASLRRGTAMLTLTHSVNQLEYAWFKSSLLVELETRHNAVESATMVAGERRTYPAFHVRTLAHRALGVLRSEFYRPEKVVPEWLADGLNARMLAFWFMDDGYMRIRPPRQPSAEIATVAFSDADRDVLLRGLQRLGLPAKATRSRLFFDTATSRKLSELIAPFVPPSMRYKLHPDVAADIPFDREAFRPGPPVVLYDEVVVEDVTERERPDTTFFCIDVEGTHNFVTSGGVVHNCRPPNNRDPHPAEIENCSHWLFEQIRLIEPRVICTLGNFATKLLRDDPAGITRVHGRDEIRQVGPRAVRLLPLFHPAAALYTASMLDTLREDFARIPALLAKPPVDQPHAEVIELPEPEPEPLVEDVRDPAPEPQPALVAEQMGLF